MATEPQIELLTKPGCHLCGEARETVGEVSSAFGLTYQEITAEDRPELAEQFAEEIPVIFIDGVQRDFWRIDPNRLRTLLSRATGS